MRTAATRCATARSKAFDHSYDGNRAPLITGNHFEYWNGGTYVRAVEETIATVCTKKNMRCLSFWQLADWLDVQDLATLAKLGRLEVGQAPEKVWTAFLGGMAASGTDRAAEADKHDWGTAGHDR